MTVLSNNISKVINTKIENKANKFDYLLVYLLFALGGVTFFSSNSRFIQIFSIFLAIVFIRKKRNFDKEFFYVILFVTFIYIAQIFIFKKFDYFNYLVLLYNIFIPYAIIKIVGVRFLSYYVKIAYFFAIVSFFFLIPSYLSKDFRMWTEQIPLILGTDPLKETNECFIIYNYQEMFNGMIKNPGPFYEAGAFGCFLMLALIINVIQKRRLFDKINIVLIITLLSTFSTAVYLSLFTFIILYYLIDKSLSVKLFFFPIIAIFFYYSYFQLNFLNEKIEQEYENAVRLGVTEERVGRIQGGMVDLNEFKNNWIFGRGLIIGTKDDDPFQTGSNNGLTDLALTYGLFGFILYFYLMTKSLKQISYFAKSRKIFAISLIIPIAIILFGQVLYIKPPFLALMFTFILFKGWPLNNPAVYERKQKLQENIAT
jgi:hypothetical protein